jgi:hypothetical protein
MTTAQIDQARLLIDAHLQRQHRQALVDQQWRIDRLGVLTAHLLNALDETQVFDVLAQHLPEMGIPWAGIALFETEGDDRVAGSNMRLIPSQATLHFQSREFPPPDLIRAARVVSSAASPRDSHSMIGPPCLIR